MTDPLGESRCMHASGGLAEWFATPLGQYLLEREQAYFDRTVADLFGFNALQLGLPEHDFLRASRIPLRCRLGNAGAVDLRADLHELPVASNSVDLALLPHVLEFGARPHQILREAGRILMPEGNLILCGFNPRSLWGLARLPKSARAIFPWCGGFIALPRLKDWLALLGLEIAAGCMDCYVPPFRQEKWLRRCAFMEKAGNRWWPIAGGVYFVHAVKRVHGMRLIMPRWSNGLAPKKNLAAVPQKVSEKSGTAAGAEWK